MARPRVVVIDEHDAHELGAQAKAILDQVPELAFREVFRVASFAMKSI